MSRRYPRQALFRHERNPTQHHRLVHRLVTEPVSKILVLFKSVPDPYEAAAAPGGASAGGKSVINPFDEIAIEEALRIRERGEASEIVGLTIGPDRKSVV